MTVHIRRPCTVQECRPHTGRHLDTCTEDTCSGCLPRLSEPGEQVCARCETTVRGGLRQLPGLWVDLLTPTQITNTRTPTNGNQRQPLSDPAHLMRDAIRAMLTTWTKTLVHERHITTPPDTIRGMAHTIAVHAGWLLNTHHADQLVHDIDWVTRNARRTAAPNPPHGVRIPCPGCGTRVRLDPDTDITICRCGQWGTLEWWRLNVAPELPDGHLDASDLVSWLLIHHQLAVAPATIRQWATRGHITRHKTIHPKPATRYDPVETLAVAKLKLTGDRRRPSTRTFIA